MVQSIVNVTDVYVVNRALAGCGLNELITSFIEVSPLGKIATYNYHLNKVKCLSMSEWNFAIGLRELTLTIDVPEDINYVYEYQLPSDMITGGLKGLVDSGDNRTIDYVFSDTPGYVWANVAEASAYYVKNVAEDQMPAWFVEWMASELALIMISPLRLEVADITFVTEWNKKAKIEAFQSDANETPAPILQIRSSIIAARNV